MKRARFVVVAVVASALLALSCGGDENNSGDCPDVSGVYQITAHSCQPQTVGSNLTIAQDGCDIPSLEPWPSWSGTVWPDGSMTWSGDAGGTLMTCDAVLSGTTVTSTCTPSCEVTLEKL
jgi:hypothetical protein